MGWMPKPNGRPRIYSWNGSDYIDPGTQWLRWMTGNLWDEYEECALYVNDNDYDVVQKIVELICS